MRARARNFFVPRESDIQSAVLEHWKTLGRPMTLVAAIPNAGAMGQPGLTCGLPDLLVMGPDIPGDHPIGFIELKRDHKRETDAQLGFALLCAKLGLQCVPRAAATSRSRFSLEKWGVVRPANVPAHLDRLLNAL